MARFLAAVSAVAAVLMAVRVNPLSFQHLPAFRPGPSQRGGRPRPTPCGQAPDGEPFGIRMSTAKRGKSQGRSCRNVEAVPGQASANVSDRPLGVIADRVRRSGPPEATVARGQTVRSHRLAQGRQDGPRVFFRHQRRIVDLVGGCSSSRPEMETPSSSRSRKRAPAGDWNSCSHSHCGAASVCVTHDVSRAAEASQRRKKPVAESKG